MRCQNFISRVLSYIICPKDVSTRDCLIRNSGLFDTCQKWIKFSLGQGFVLLSRTEIKLGDLRMSNAMNCKTSLLYCVLFGIFFWLLNMEFFGSYPATERFCRVWWAVFANPTIGIGKSFVALEMFVADLRYIVFIWTGFAKYHTYLRQILYWICIHSCS